MAQLRDHVEFVIGMTIVTESGREIDTGDMELDPITYDGRTIVTIRRKGSPCSTDLRNFYSSQKSRILCQMEVIEHDIAQMVAMKDRLRETGNPAEFMDYLTRSVPHVWC